MRLVVTGHLVTEVSGEGVDLTGHRTPPARYIQPVIVDSFTRVRIFWYASGSTRPVAWRITVS